MRVNPAGKSPPLAAQAIDVIDQCIVLGENLATACKANGAPGGFVNHLTGNMLRIVIDHPIDGERFDDCLAIDLSPLSCIAHFSTYGSRCAIEGRQIKRN